MLCPALQSLPGRTGQVGLDPIARERNARRVRVRRVSERRLRGRSVILVDDIVTTGASMRAAIAVLERAGARVEAVVALATAVRRDSPQKTEWNLTGERG
ncbi:ComF family protein [Leucobacter sp. BZR 635]